MGLAPAREGAMLLALQIRESDSSGPAVKREIGMYRRTPEQQKGVFLVLEKARRGYMRPLREKPLGQPHPQRDRSSAERVRCPGETTWQGCDATCRAPKTRQ